MTIERSSKDASPPPNGDGTALSAEAAIAMHSDPRFLQLKQRLYRFIFPMSIAFLAWYLLYVLMSAFGRDVMGTVLFGNVNVALVFGVLQFASTFGIAICYTLYARRHLDPAAAEVREALREKEGSA
ncbi:DUF485 domain-containing protein [Nocardiopsis lambiniae]|uniref:DUF485 domain-containing protein n=1 Tax=Nocardiopsis lambiniae TaxID=3075539 RepID=A0ABU2M8K4_9ACTN|nr:DUF485 domain-containing protein [Nocardiopsis sp. DSM 44743]MDT0328995.1 DUF485 domain-containing protein [Nocardiopsis sp. DSM 44743]